jgi:DNA-binding GntR family transcriptional regulator
MVVTLTKQQAIYQHLKDRILEGRLAPGQRLIIDEIAAQLGISIIPVREALQLLQAERLVEIRPHAGATVAAITPANIEEVFTILEGMEAVAARRVAKKIPPQIDARLQKVIQEMDIAEKQEDVERWSALNMDFHLAISDASGMPWLREITARALGNWDRIRRYFFREGRHHRFTQAQKDHHAILIALRKGDADEAERVLRRHNQRACRYYYAAATALAEPAEAEAEKRGKVVAAAV